MHKPTTLIAAGLLAWASLANQAQAARKDAPIDSKGQPCVSFFELARLQSPGSGIYEHFVTTLNQCERTVHLRLCYRGSSECSAVTVDAGADVRTALGTKVNQPYFAIQWSYEEAPAAWRPAH